MACLRQVAALVNHGTAKVIMKQHVIPPDAIVSELEAIAAECENKAANEPEPRATELREEAKLYRDWATALRSERWTVRSGS